MAKRSDDPKNRRDDAGPREDVAREAQGRKSGRAQAKSPVDKRHIDAPKQQKNARGHRTMPQRGR